jgi:type IV secretion system protein VirB5
MRRLLLTALAASVLAPAPAYAQGVPVIDTSNLVAQARSLFQDLRSYATQIQQLQTQAQQVMWAAHQYQSLVAHPSLSSAMGLVNQLGMGDALPVNPHQVQSMVRGVTGLGGATGISGALGSLSTLANTSFGQNHVYTPKDSLWASNELSQRGHGIAGTQGIAQQVHAAIAERFPLLARLKADALRATTPAEREHVANQLAAEQAWTANMAGQLQSVTILAAAEDRSRGQRAQEMLMESADSQIEQAEARGLMN